MRSPSFRSALSRFRPSDTSAKVLFLAAQAVLVFLVASAAPDSAALAALLFVLQIAAGVFTRRPLVVLSAGTAVQLLLLLFYVFGPRAILADTPGPHVATHLRGVVLLMDQPERGMRVDLPPGRTEITDERGEFGFTLLKGEEIAVITVDFNGKVIRFVFDPPVTTPSFLELPLERPAHPRVRPLPVVP